MAQLELKSLHTFLSIKRCQQRKIQKVFKLEQSSFKNGHIYVTIGVILLICKHHVYLIDYEIQPYMIDVSCLIPSIFGPRVQESLNLNPS